MKTERRGGARTPNLNWAKRGATYPLGLFCEETPEGLLLRVIAQDYPANFARRLARVLGRRVVSNCGGKIVEITAPNGRKTYQWFDPQNNPKQRIVNVNAQKLFPTSLPPQGG